MIPGLALLFVFLILALFFPIFWPVIVILLIVGIFITASASVGIFGLLVVIIIVVLISAIFRGGVGGNTVILGTRTNKRGNKTKPISTVTGSGTDPTYDVLVPAHTPSSTQKEAIYGQFRLGWQAERFRLDGNDVAFANAQIAAILQKRLPGEKIMWTRFGRTYRDDDLDTVGTMGMEDDQVSNLIAKQAPNDSQQRQSPQFGDDLEGRNWFDITVTATRK